MSRALPTRIGAVLAVCAAVATSSLVLGRPLDRSAAATPGPVTRSVTATRVHLDDGKDDTVLSEKVTLSVDATTDLHDRQGIQVSWSGAVPTRGVIADSNSSQAVQQEYPMVLLQCRGTQETITPETCWAPTAPERYSYLYDTDVPFPPWRLDRYASAADRAAVVDAPDPRPERCPSPPDAEHWVPFIAADGTKFYGGANDCGGLPPEAAGVDATLGLPSNATYAATGLDGKGSVSFNVRDAQDNASLGCSQKVACALVAIPIVGISCDVAATGLPADERPQVGDQADAASDRCHRSGAFQPGQLVSNPQNLQDPAVSGALWWSASNWRNRMVVPISFGVPSNVCELGSAKNPTLIYGSELMIQATAQWLPKFCLDPNGLPIKHVQTGEPQARNLLGTGSVEGALVSYPDDPVLTRPTVHAPVAMSGFAISYTIDDAKRDTYSTLRLNARLLAKLLTESYPAIPAIQQSYAALAKNPLNITLDPEFVALNPGITQGVPASISASTLFTISSDSDVIRALTAYIGADPEARAWLDGKPDPWGMTVNPNYKGISLPTQNWPLLDTFEPTGIYQPGINDCLAEAPVPYLPLVASPTSRLANVALSMQFAIANSQTTCSQPLQGTTAGQKLVAVGRQTKGFRFMIGVTSLADAERFGITTAALQSQSTVAADTKITDGSGRTFVAADPASLKAAADTLRYDPATRSWPMDYSALRTTAAGKQAYPGTMVVYADVPTTGLSKGDAAAFAQLLSFAARDGQSAGSQVGQLPSGYLPLTSGNGLGALADYTARAATAVADQRGEIPPLVPITSSPSPAPTPAAAGSTGGNAGTVPGGGAPGAASAPTPAAAAASGGSPRRPSAAPSSSPGKASPIAAAPAAKTIGSRSSTTIAVVLVVLLLALGPIAAPVTLFLARRGSGR